MCVSVAIVSKGKRSEKANEGLNEKESWSGTEMMWRWMSSRLITIHLYMNNRPAYKRSNIFFYLNHGVNAWLRNVYVYGRDDVLSFAVCQSTGERC